MADTIPDLWDNDIQVDDLSPVIILNSQAANLQRRTQGIVVAEVIKRTSADFTEVFFDIKSVTTRHRNRLLVCRNLGSEVYPTYVTSISLPSVEYDYGYRNRIIDIFQIELSEVQQTHVAWNQKDFFKLVSIVFSSNWVKAKISSMIAVSNEANTVHDHLIDESAPNNLAK